MTVEGQVLGCVARGVNTYGRIAAALHALDEPRTRRIDRALQRLRRKGLIRWDKSDRVWRLA